MMPARIDFLTMKDGFFSRHERLIFRLSAAGLIAVSAVLHFWKISSIPPGFHNDESSNAYNAYCIAETGADEYGVRFPIFFRALDDYRDPLLIYPLVPFVKLFGLERGVSRLPSASFLLLASVVFALLVYHHGRNEWLAMLSGFCFSMLPWVFVMSRITSGYTPMLLGMIAGWLFLLWAMEKLSCRLALAAGGAWAFGMYCYSIARPMSVLMLVCFGIAYFGALRRAWKVGLVFVAGCVAFMIPQIASVVGTPQILTSRFEKISIFQDHPSWDRLLSRFGSRYIEYFSPEFLFLKGDGNLRQHSGFGGELFLFLVPLVLTGLYCLLRSFKSRSDYRFITLGLLVYPIAAALTLGRMHSGRSVHGVVFWALTAAIGAHYLWQHRGLGRNILLISSCAGLIEMGLYLNDYFRAYPVRSRGAFNAAYTEALEECFVAVGKGQTVYISGSTFALWKMNVSSDFNPYVYVDVLFFGKIDPRVYQQSGIPRDRVRLYDGTIAKPGRLIRCNMRWIQMPEDWTPLNAPTGVRRDGDQLLRPYLFDTNTELIPEGAELLETKPAGGVFRYEIYRVK
jgi:hypothetical protein